jgi:hypothetical protein
LTPDCGILKHSHYPLLEACGIARGRTFSQIQGLLGINTLYSGGSLRIPVGFMHCFIDNKTASTIQNSAERPLTQGRE